MVCMAQAGDDTGVTSQARSQSRSGHLIHIHPRTQITGQGQGQAGSSACSVPLLLERQAGIRGVSTHSCGKPFEAV